MELNLTVYYDCGTYRVANIEMDGCYVHVLKVFDTEKEAVECYHRLLRIAGGLW